MLRKSLLGWLYLFQWLFSPFTEEEYRKLHHPEDE